MSSVRDVVRVHHENMNIFIGSRKEEYEILSSYRVLLRKEMRYNPCTAFKIECGSLIDGDTRCRTKMARLGRGNDRVYIVT